MLTYRGTPVPKWLIAVTIALPTILAIVLICLDY